MTHVIDGKEFTELTNLEVNTLLVNGVLVGTFGSLTQAGATATVTTISNIGEWTQTNVVSFPGAANSGYSSPSNGVLKRTGPDADQLVIIGSSNSSGAGALLYGAFVALELRF